MSGELAQVFVLCAVPKWDGKRLIRIQNMMCVFVCGFFCLSSVCLLAIQSVMTLIESNFSFIGNFISGFWCLSRQFSCFRTTVKWMAWQKCPIYVVDGKNSYKELYVICRDRRHIQQNTNVLMLIWISIKNGFRKLNNHGFDDWITS